MVKTESFWMIKSFRSLSFEVFESFWQRYSFVDISLLFPPPTRHFKRPFFSIETTQTDAGKLGWSRR